ncbi:MAG: rane protein [Polaromonas sp.]|nr:rane protein [Polaromonas sp.]
MTTASSGAAGAPAATDPRSFKSFSEFYPFYLTEHSNRTCRRLHFAGSTLTLLCLAALAFTRQPLWLLAALLCGYVFAWIGHFFFEKNRPASFKRPLYSFIGDWAMYRDIWAGKVRL